MTRTLGPIAYMLYVLIVLISIPCAVSAAIVTSANGHHPLIQSNTLETASTRQSRANTKVYAITTSSNTLDANTPDFIQQITHAPSPLSMDLALPHVSQNNQRDDNAIQLIGKRPLIRGNGTRSLLMDSSWSACCGDGTVLAAIDSSFHTLVNTTERQTRRSASLVAIAKTSTALPLSFEVSRRVRGKSVPEPASLTLLSMASLLLLRRPRPRPREIGITQTH